jgi:hypothetical protein
MRLEFDEGDEGAFHDAREQLLDRFDRWRGGQPYDAERWTAELLMQFKWGYLDGHLGRWGPGDLGEILLEIFPRKVTMDLDEVPAVVPATRRFLAFLAETGLLDTRSADTAILEAALDRIAEELPSCMADTSRFGLAKSLFAGDGAGARAPRTAVPLTRPVLLPSVEESTRAAADVPLLARLRAFAKWAGEGRALTAKGNLTLADGRALIDLLGTGDRIDPDYGGRTFKTKSSVEFREVDFTFRLARGAGFVKVLKGRVSATARGAALGADALMDWNAALDGLIKLGVLRHHYANNRYFDPYWKDLVDGELRALLWSLLDGPQPIETLGERMWYLVESSFVLTNLDDEALARHREQVARDVRRVVETLGAIGAATIEGVREERNDIGFERAVGGVAALTSPGVAASYRLAVEAGLDVAAVGTMRGADAPLLLTALRGVDPDQAGAETDAWLADREPGDAAQQLARSAVDAAGDVDQVAAAFAALAKLPTAEVDAALRPYADDERLEAFVTAWRSLHSLGGAGPAPQPTASSLLAARTVGGTDAVVATLAVVGDLPAQCALLDRLRSEGEPAVPVLQHVADGHPDKTVAKAARKALFKLRSAGFTIPDPR